jgi:hypothetical protein
MHNSRSLERAGLPIDSVAEMAIVYFENSFMCSYEITQNVCGCCNVEITDISEMSEECQYLLCI